MKLIDGLPVKNFCRYFLPFGAISGSAERIHGHTRAMLTAKGAKPFNKDDADDIISFLGANPKILAHNTEFDHKILNG